MLITPAYLATQKRVHKAQPAYGISSKCGVAAAKLLHESYGVESIIDYGCGKGRLKIHYPYVSITEYDPAIEGKDNPNLCPADAVLCHDVMEHIEERCLPDVMRHMTALALTYLYLTITTRPARKILPDGRNAHITLWTPKEWLTFLEQYLTIIMERDENHELTVLGIPK